VTDHLSFEPREIEMRLKGGNIEEL
jgi:hypothetical protein